jgi:ATP-dependent DNA helicase RecG
MTATPIPRTIALTLYGDLELSVIDQMPPGRKKVKTWAVPLIKRPAAYQWIEKQIKKDNSQAFIVCPLIEQSEIEMMKDIKAAKVEFDRLKKKVFPKLKLGLLHGKLKNKEKEKAIDQFKQKKLNILVSTPVVEVGVDIPNAIIMVIEGADRFGLAQLHQLRGRVGRSQKQAYCLLFASTKDKQSLKRLKVMEKYNSGFKLAEIDLKIRGPGEIYGTRQHGFKKLKVADFTDSQLVKKTRTTAENTINQLNKFPLLKEKLKSYTMKLIEPN